MMRTNLADGRMIVEQAEDVVERRPQLGRHDSALGPVFSILTVRQDVDFGDGQTLPGEPDDVVVELERLGVSGDVQLPESARTVQLPGQQYRQTQHLIEGGGEEGVGRCGFFGEATQDLLLDLRHGHGLVVERTMQCR